MNEDEAKHIADAVGFQIAKETLLECNPNISDTEVADIWAKCGDDPWNAVPLYQILKIAQGTR